MEEEKSPGIRALQRASLIAEEYGISEMTLDEAKAKLQRSLYIILCRYLNYLFKSLNRYLINCVAATLRF